MSLQIDVCVCTYRRSSLAKTLHSIAAQQLPPGTKLRVIVADNDETPSALPLVEKASADLGLACAYVHAPSRNISIARNACLDAATAPLLAFIDDDEVATATWLASLIASQRSSGAAVVFGPVQAIYAAGPAWLQNADLHSIKPVIRRDGRIDTGYTSNVLLNRQTLGQALLGCRFDPGLGRSGGEDSSFFHNLYKSGARLAFCDGALVTEQVTPNRANLTWLVKRSFRSGQTHCRMLLSGQHPRPAIAAIAAAKLGYSLASAAVAVMSPSGWRRSLVRGALHAGVFAGSIGFRDLQLY
jgi:succinoglycan biosynthesis protein ExoM